MWAFRFRAFFLVGFLKKVANVTGQIVLGTVTWTIHKRKQVTCKMQHNPIMIENSRNSIDNCLIVNNESSLHWWGIQQLMWLESAKDMPHQSTSEPMLAIHELFPASMSSFTMHSRSTLATDQACTNEASNSYCDQNLLKTCRVNQLRTRCLSFMSCCQHPWALSPCAQCYY